MAQNRVLTYIHARRKYVENPVHLPFTFVFTT